MLKETHAQLAEAEDRLRSLREEKSRALKVAEAAKGAFAESDNEATLAAAKAAKDAVTSVEERIEQVQENQISLLRRLGDTETDRGGVAFAGVDGWRDVARHLDLDQGELRADVSLGALMRPLAGLNLTGSATSVATARAAFSQQPVDRRFLYPQFPRTTLDVGTLAVVDFRQDSASGTVTGDVVRNPMSVDPKAELDIGITAGSEDVKQFAITIDNVPQALFSAESALQAFLRSRMQHVLDLALDTHVLAQIMDAGPPSGSSGTGLIERVRNAVAAARGLGAAPSVLALNPADAAALDLTTTGADNAYVFATRDTGSASPLWSLRVVELPSVTDPMLIDPGLTGALYAGTGTVMVDPYTGMKTNTVRMRLEIEALLHVRAASGAYVIA
jgi:hypothetical protein